MKPLVYLSPAEAEMIEAAVYYDSQREGLGRLFLEAIGATEMRLKRNPRLWAFRAKPVRSCRVERFPYRLYYVEESDRVVIVLSRMPVGIQIAGKRVYVRAK